MIPNGAPIPDLLRGLVPQPANVPPPGEGGPEEEQEAALPVPLLQVGSNCASCERRVNRFVVASPEALRILQILLVTDELKLVCNSCVRRSLALNRRHNGR